MWAKQGNTNKHGDVNGEESQEASALQKELGKVGNRIGGPLQGGSTLIV